MRITKRQLRALIKEAVTTSHQFASSGFISLESDPYSRVEITSDGQRTTIDMSDFMAFLRKAGLTDGGDTYLSKRLRELLEHKLV